MRDLSTDSKLFDSGLLHGAIQLHRFTGVLLAIQP
jgi:hypothetical protein